MVMRDEIGTEENLGEKSENSHKTELEKVSHPLVEGGLVGRYEVHRDRRQDKRPQRRSLDVNKWQQQQPWGEIHVMVYHVIIHPLQSLALDDCCYRPGGGGGDDGYWRFLASLSIVAG
ncbi:hypothetical protein BOTCAL_0283g00050 [Botryotinia calthae]|uniref:Uncharacterized protein n=1 Tax=Botryotinia calthae TaxID=38488 RepID=A0A4Y8CV61_9HELO|nr:hypothetical protein BOTCAL_0283g00050 [Botryotinia calthae]